MLAFNEIYRETVMQKKHVLVVFLVFAFLSGCSSVQQPKNGDAKAEYEYAFQLQTEKRDYASARYWYELSAKHGNKWAQNNLNMPPFAPATIEIVDNQTTATSQSGASNSLALGNKVLAHNVSVKLNNIDDLGIVFVQNSDGNIKQVSLAEWSARFLSGSPGSAKESLNKHLKPGQNLVFFILHNKSFNYGSGKWTYDFSLIGDGTVLFHKANGKNGGSVGIQDWVAFSVESRTDGTFLIGQASEYQVSKISPKVANINADLIKNHGHESSSDVVAAVIGVGLGAGAVALAVSSDSSSDSSDTVNNDRNYSNYLTQNSKDKKEQVKADKNNDFIETVKPQEQKETPKQTPSIPTPPISPFYGDCHGTDC